MSGTKVVKLRLEDGGGEKLPMLKGDVVERALELYDAIESHHTVTAEAEDYANILKQSKGFDLSSGQLQLVLDRIADGPAGIIKNNLGLFLTALIQGSKHSDFKIKTKIPLRNFGFKLKDKRITVEGNLEDWTGNQMESGRIMVNGNVGSDTGHKMRGGEIIIDGNAAYRTGFRMKGGKTHVKGSVLGALGAYMEDGLVEVDGNGGENVGLAMNGGIIKVKGDITSFGDFYTGGEIWEKGVKKKG
ncbi:MAG: hypothetical protein V1921_06700 [Candidatus Altiarchaeota archaeon]